MKAYYSYCALSGVDKQCMEYISVYSGQTTETAAPAGADMPLDQAVIKGLKESAHAAAQELLKTTEPLEIINKLLVPLSGRCEAKNLNKAHCSFLNC